MRAGQRSKAIAREELTVHSSCGDAGEGPAVSSGPRTPVGFKRTTLDCATPVYSRRHGRCGARGADPPAVVIVSTRRHTFATCQHSQRLLGPSNNVHYCSSGFAMQRRVIWKDLPELAIFTKRPTFSTRLSWSLVHNGKTWGTENERPIERARSQEQGRTLRARPPSPEPGDAGETKRSLGPVGVDENGLRQAAQGLGGISREVRLEP